MISQDEDDSTRTRKKWTFHNTKGPLLLGIIAIILLVRIRSEHSIIMPLYYQQQQGRKMQSNNNELDLSSSSSNPLLITTKIACVGDSLTRGEVGQGVQHGRDDYPTQLQNMLNNDNNNVRHYEVRNFGINGAMAFRGKKESYDTARAFRPSLEFQPDVVLIMLGTNDGTILARLKKQLGRQQEQLGMFERDYEWLIRQYYDNDDDSNSTTKTRIIVAVPPRIDRDQKWFRDGVMEKSIAPSVRSVAKRFGVPLRVVDMRPITHGNSSLFSDGVHLSARGYEAVAEAWKNAILATTHDAKSLT